MLDLIHPLNSREVSRREVEVFASKHTCAWVEISAKTDAHLIGEQRNTGISPQITLIFRTSLSTLLATSRRSKSTN